MSKTSTQSSPGKRRACSRPPTAKGGHSPRRANLRPRSARLPRSSGGDEHRIKRCRAEQQAWRSGTGYPNRLGGAAVVGGGPGERFVE